MGRVSRAPERFLLSRCQHTPHPPPPQCMYLLNSGAETLFLVPGVPKQLILPSATSDSKTIKREMDGKMQPPSGVGGRKRQNLTLDLNSASPKKNKVQNLLTSPDVQMLKLTSPELEKFLSQNPSLATPTPSGYVFPKSVTEEQMMYAKGFEEALEKIKYQENFGPNTDTVTAANTLVTLSSGQAAQLDQLPLSLPNTSLSLSSLPPNNPLSRPNSGASGSYDSDTYQLPEGSVPVKIKDEPDDRSVDDDDEESLLSPGGAGVSPIDMETQEKIKLERKRLRNRQAAAKCRKRKLERISLLDDRVAQLKTENTDLAAVVKKMKSSVAALKQEVLDHVNSGCEIRMSDATVFS